MNFDFEKIKKSVYSEIILEPTIHMALNGNTFFYCLEQLLENTSDSFYFQLAIDDHFLAFKFDEVKHDNSYTIRKVVRASNNITFVAALKAPMHRDINLEKWIGTNYNSANFKLQRSEKDVLYIDLSAPVNKYKK